jgi:hypothetical protein
VLINNMRQDVAMRYALLAYENPEAIAARTDDEQVQLLAAYGRVAAALAQRGAMIFGDGLASPGSATTVRGGSTPVVHDGPAVETREHLIGIFVIEAADLDEALGWARQMPHATGYGSVEVRPVGV